MIHIMNPISLTPLELAAYIDHTLLRADSTIYDIEALCTEAREYVFFSVCVNGSWVLQARHLLEDTGIRVGTVAGFPLGAMSIKAKCLETATAINDGAQEIDVVLNIGRLKQGDDPYIFQELSEIVKAADRHPVKVILETCLLSEDEKIRGCRLAVESGASFVKTSTGFNAGGATIDDVSLLRETVGPDFGVKASGGIRDARTVLAMIDAGASRIGTSSGVAIIKEFAEK